MTLKTSQNGQPSMVSSVAMPAARRPSIVCLTVPASFANKIHRRSRVNEFSISSLFSNRNLKRLLKRKQRHLSSPTVGGCSGYASDGLLEAGVSQDFVQST